MYRQLLGISLCCALLVCVSGIPANGQDFAELQEDDVTRVIKLRSNDPPEAPVPSNPIEAESPPQDRVARRQDQLPDPTKIQYVEIESSKPKSTRKPAQAKFKVDAQSGPVVDQKFATARTLGSHSTPSVLTASEISPAYVTNTGPQLTAKVISAKYVNVGENTTVKIQLQNISRQNAKNVKLVASIPPHAKILRADPQPIRVDGQNYEFAMNEINSRQMFEIKLDLVATEKLPVSIGTQIFVVNSQTISVGVRQPNINVRSRAPELRLPGSGYQVPSLLKTRVMESRAG